MGVGNVYTLVAMSNRGEVRMRIATLHSAGRRVAAAQLLAARRELRELRECVKRINTEVLPRYRKGS